VPRTIVYTGPSPPQRSVRRGPATAAGGGAGDAALASRDDLLARIAKYVPAEMITLVTLGFAAFPPDGNTVWVFVAIGAVLNVIYLFGTALSTAGAPRPPWFFYLLSAAAFVGWALVTVDAVQEKAGLDGDNATTQQGFILLGTAIFIPLVDIFFSRIFVRAEGS
jgi:hypothetical protein